MRWQRWRLSRVASAGSLDTAMVLYAFYFRVALAAARTDDGSVRVVLDAVYDVHLPKRLRKNTHTRSTDQIPNNDLSTPS